NNLSLLFPYFPRCLLNAARVREDYKKKERSHRERDQCELPIQIQHHAQHAHQGEAVDHRIEEPGNDEALNGVDVARDAADQIAGLLVIVIRKGKTLNM